MSKKMMIIDGSSLIYRAFYALPLLTTSGGLHTNAVYGFTSMLLKLLEDVKPEAIVVGLDKGKKTFRNDAFPLYKAHRKPTPGELSEQFPLLKEVLRIFGVTVIEQEGYEADDIIGTVATQAAQSGFEVLIVTGDKDALQLINPNVKVLLTKKGITELEVVDEACFIDKYGIQPKQFIDIKGLMGDTSDNIPGVAGVGEKTAFKLIQQFGSIENLLNHLDSVSGKKLRETLEAQAQTAVLSKQLATIVCDMPLVLEIEHCGWQPDYAQLQKLFTQLEFRSLLNRIRALQPDQPEIEVQSEALPPLIVPASEADVRHILDEIQGRLIFYPIIHGQVPNVTLAGLAIALSEKTVYFSPASPGWPECLQLIADTSVQKVTHDAKRTANAIRSLQGDFQGLAFDSLIAAYLLDPAANEYSPQILAEKYLDRRLSWQENEIEDTRYAIWVAGMIRELQPILSESLQNAGLTKLYNDVELPLTKVLSSMEMGGVKVDQEILCQMSEELADKINALLSDIYQLAGEEFNVNSTKQLGTILFDKLHLPVLKKTKTGYSTDAEVLEKLSGEHIIVDKLLEYRMISKLKSTYLDGMERLIFPETARIHTTFNQTVTTTGRLSSSEPNLQNIPVRTETGRRIRNLFVPGPGWDYIMSADYSQIELRVLAHMSGDRNLLDAFHRNQDIHTRTAAEVFGVPLADVTPTLRFRAKAVNFGIVYGISDYGLSRDIGVSRKEAEQYIESYFARYPGVKQYMDHSIAQARQTGYVTTLFGRRRYLPDINSTNFNIRSFAERTAMNTPIQGTAADIIKKAMIDVYQRLTADRFKSRILLQVHDELLLEVSEAEVEEVARIVKAAMEEAVALSVPLVTDVKWGKNWSEAK